MSGFKASLAAPGPHAATVTWVCLLLVALVPGGPTCVPVTILSNSAQAVFGSKQRSGFLTLSGKARIVGEGCGRPGAGMGFPTPAMSLAPLQLQGCDWRMHLTPLPVVFVSMLFDLTLLHSPCADRNTPLGQRKVQL